jgi:hypothetical protein
MINSITMLTSPKTKSLTLAGGYSPKHAIVIEGKAETGAATRVSFYVWQNGNEVTVLSGGGSFTQRVRSRGGRREAVFA